MGKKRILSGMRPTGPLHMGHLVGALTNWRNLQDRYECFYMVADWHALMSEYAKPDVIREVIEENVAGWLSCGIDPKKSRIFIQSQIKEHAELYLLFSCITPLGWLQRCPTYKEQLKQIKDKDIKTYAFLGYPVLQAADILIYQAQAVPVGEDQLPHLELTREIARRFNSLYKRKFFPEPEAILTKTPRLLGIDNRKMSKNYGNFIALSDKPEIIIKKASRMITDPRRIKKLDPGHPSICNVFSYYDIFNKEAVKDVRDWCENARIGCRECKRRLAEIIIELLKPIQLKRDKLLNDRGQIKKILKEGNEKARAIAAKTLQDAKRIVKFYGL
jgi:tryptophanyl-tRNA synthetase